MAKDTRSTQIPATLRSMDDRLRALEAWLATALEDRTRIAMDAPPEREDSRPFVHVARLLREAGLHAPEVLAQDLSQGFLLLTDLGTRSYLAALREGRDVDRLFGDATSALVRWQSATRAGELPPYDE